MPLNQTSSDQTAPSPVRRFCFQDQEWRFPRRPLIMGILNATPDSFSDGGRFTGLEQALQQARAMIEGGADLLDIGGESTRPGAVTVEVEEEKKRVLPIINALLKETKVPLSIDTRKAAVAAAALQAGAAIVNDISGLQYDPAMMDVLRNSKAGVIIMHMRGTPQTMQNHTQYQDVTAEICRYFRQIMQKTADCGIASDRIMLDPGLGFSKTAEQNLQLLARLPQLHVLGRPLLIGPSRKSFIGRITNQEVPENRQWGTAAAVAAAVLGGADVLRVHDVAAMREVADVAAAIYREK